MSIPPLVEPVARLSAAESARTVSHRGLPQLTEVDRRRLAGARVLVLGAGRLGSPTIRSLASVGVGTIGIVAGDDVEPATETQSETQSAPRTETPEAGSVATAQPVKRSGRHAAESAADTPAATPADTAADNAAESAAEIAPQASIIRHPDRLGPDNAFELLGGYDLVIDCADNFPAPFLANDTCAALGLPLVWASVLHGDAQLSVFWAHPPAGSEVTGVHLRDLYPAPPQPDERPTAADAYVLGALSGQVGALMAGEAIKLLTGTGEPLIGRLLTIDALSGRFTETPLLGTGADLAAATVRDSGFTGTLAAEPRAAEPRSSESLSSEPQSAQG